MHTTGTSPARAAILIVLSLLLTATMALAYGGGGSEKEAVANIEDGITQNELSVSFDNASPSTETTNVESFGGSTISRSGMAAIGQVFPEAGGADMARHLDGMGKTLEVLDHGRLRGHGGLTAVKGVPLVTGSNDPVEGVGSPAETKIGGFTPNNGPNAFERACNGSDPERNPEQEQIRARVQKAVSAAAAQLTEAGVQPPAGATPSESLALAAKAVGATNLARLPRYVPSPVYAPGTGR